ncbi:MAG TPA: GDP-L-fucose synthase [Candidatus Cybelea sp.]|nr:GDP-L-fucose synthase [Candidatus Cybelea sp.]
MSLALDKPQTASFDLAGRRVWVAGHRGLAGSAILRRLEGEGCTLLTATRAELDLRNQRATEDWMAKARPEAVFLAAAKVGGILANDRQPADFIAENLAIETNVITAAAKTGVGKLLFLGSSCVYPKFAPQPIKEESLLTGPLEPTNEWYAIAKIAGIKLCQAYRRQHGSRFISCMPTNLYGPNDNFDPETSHVLAALLRKIHAAKAAGGNVVEIWGSGTPRREFLHVDDLADACVFLMKHYEDALPINIGTGEDLPIADLARVIAGVVGYRGEFVFDRSKPDGTPRKQLDVSRMTALGWKPKIALKDGIAQTYRAYLARE